MVTADCSHCWRNRFTVADMSSAASPAETLVAAGGGAAVTLPERSILS